jgi:hypothetical protein
MIEYWQDKNGPRLTKDGKDMFEIPYFDRVHSLSFTRLSSWYCKIIVNSEYISAEGEVVKWKIIQRKGETLAEAFDNAITEMINYFE